jgi:hypothetical protein
MMRMIQLGVAVRGLDIGFCLASLRGVGTSFEKGPKVKGGQFHGHSPFVSGIGAGNVVEPGVLMRSSGRPFAKQTDSWQSVARRLDLV